MFFTQEDYKKIEDYLKRQSVKDTEFESALPIKEEDSLAVIQNGHNRKIHIYDFLDSIKGLLGKDFVCLGIKESLEEAIQSDELLLNRKPGKVITFGIYGPDNNIDWKIYQFRSDDANQFLTPNAWVDLFADKALDHVIDSIIPDNEDLALTPEQDENGNDIIRLKDRRFNEFKFGGKGSKILRRDNIEQDENGVEHLVLRQDMMNDENTIYHIRYDYDLMGQIINVKNGCIIHYEGGSVTNGGFTYNDTIIEGNEIIKNKDTFKVSGKYTYIGLPKVNTDDLHLSEDNTLELANRDTINGKGFIILRKDKSFKEQVTKTNTVYEIRYNFDLESTRFIIPSGCILYFNGGSLSNGKLRGNNTGIIASNYEIFKSGTIKFNGCIKNGNSTIWKYVEKIENDLTLEGDFKYSKFLPEWVGLDKINPDEDASIKLNKLFWFGKNDVIKLPKNTYNVYGRLHIYSNVDFNGSIINSIDFNKVQDTTIPITEEGWTPYKLRSLYGLIHIENPKITIENAIIDGRKSSRYEQYPEINFGSVSLIDLGWKGDDFTIKNCELKNGFENAFTTSYTKNITIDNCYIHNFGEHCIYTHCKEGIIHILNSRIENCSDEESIYKVRGMSDIFKMNSLDSDVADINKVNIKLLVDNSIITFTEGHRQSLVYDGYCLESIFTNCTFNEESVYSSSTKEVLQKYKVKKYQKSKFINCINPPSPNGVLQTSSKVELIDCSGNFMIFADRILVENCNGSPVYEGLNLDFNSLYVPEEETSLKDVPCVIKDCTFLVGDYVKRAYTRDLYMDNVKFHNNGISSTQSPFTAENIKNITLNNVQVKDCNAIYLKNIDLLICNNCVNNTSTGQLSFIEGSTNDAFKIKKAIINNCISYNVFNGRFIKNINICKAYNINNYINHDKNKNPYYIKKQLTFTNGIETKISNSNVIELPENSNIEDFIRIIPVNNFVPFTCSINYTSGEIIGIIINGISEPSKFEVIIDMTSYNI